MGKITGNTACPSCKKIGRDSKDDHLMLFEDGGAYCNRCGYTEKKETFTKPTSGTITGEKSSEEVEKELAWVLDNSVIQGMKDRKLTLMACKRYGVRTGLSLEDGKTPVCTYLPISDGKGVQGYKVKTPDKRIWSKGNAKDAHFFGAHVVRPKGNKLFITEGQEDCLALYQAMYEFLDEKWRGNINVVSLQNGAGAAAREMAINDELIRGYKEIVLCFDQDEAGNDAVEKVLTVLNKDKVKVAKLVEKDANDMVKQGLSKDLYFSVLQASSPRPEKIVCGLDRNMLKKPLMRGITTPYPVLDEKMRGMRYGEGGGELTIVCAGTGMGKTTLAREMMYKFNAVDELKLANFFLEEQKYKTGQSYIAIDNNVPLGHVREDPLGAIGEKAFDLSCDKLIDNGRNYFFDHWGSIDSVELMDHMYYCSAVLGCNFGLLDHISLVISGQESSSEGERKDLDILMTRLATFVETSGMSVIAIVHLKRPSNGSFNDGAQISLNHLRGSAAIEQLAHNIIAVEGNQHGVDPNERTVRILKAREWGDIGVADILEYNGETGRLLPKQLVGMRG
jgi:twinkle protein